MRSLLVIAVLLLASCASAPETRYYSLEDFTSEQNLSCDAGVSRPIQLTVLPFKVLPPFNTARIVYRPPDLPQTIGFYASHRWATSPARMLAQATKDYLCHIGINARLSTADQSADKSVTLSADVSELLEVDTPEGPTGQVALTLRVQNGDRKRVLEQELWGRAPAHENTVDSVVQAIHKALQIALSRIQARIERLVQASEKQ
jgi:uncharacterized lipoprotein YmbA